MGRLRREEDELLKLLQSEHDAEGQEAEDDGEQTEDDATASSSDSESSCDDEIANAMETTTGTRFKYFDTFKRNSSAVEITVSRSGKRFRSAELSPESGIVRNLQSEIQKLIK